MANPLPRMGHAEIKDRQQKKFQKVLWFLSTEVWTTTSVVAELCKISRPVADATLRAMCREKLIKTEQHTVDGRKTNIYGITTHGLVTFGSVFGKPFELGKVKASHLQHRVEIQILRVAADSAGWKEWRHEFSLRRKNWGKVPDALVTNPAGHVIAVEVERTAKERKAYEDILTSYLIRIKEGDVHFVDYVCPPKIVKGIENIFNRIKYVRYQGDRIELTDIHRKRFRFYAIGNWPPVAVSATPTTSNSEKK